MNARETLNFLVLLLITVTFVTGLHPERTKEFTVSQDAYISKRDSSTNFGSELQSFAGKDIGGERLVTLVEFSTNPPECTPGLPAQEDPCYTAGISEIDRILDATITLKVNDTSGVTLRMYPTTSFNENTATWNNAGDKSGELVDQIVLDSSSTIAEFTATKSIQEGHRSFLIEILGSGSSSEVVFETRESNQPAVLSVKEGAVELTPPETGCEELFVLIDGLNISYTDCPYTGNRGNPPVCLWMHGAPTNKNLWRNQHQYVQSVCRSIAPSMPGSGLSQDVDLSGGKAILTETSRIIKLFVQELDLQKINCFGQDFGDGVCRMIELDLVNEGLIDGIWSSEGVMANSIICSPEGEQEGRCARDGSVGSSDSFTQQCYIEDISVNSEDKCGTYILSRNWFYNATMFFDPNVKDQSVFFPILPGTLMPTAPTLISLPVAGLDDVIQTLTFNLQPAELANQIYDKEKILSLNSAPQVLQNWPRTLAQSGQVDSVNSAPYRQLLLDTREAYETDGVLANIPKYFLNMAPGTVAVPSTTDVAWANDHYCNFYSFTASRGASHYFPEDETGAQDVGLWIVQILS